MKILPPIQGLTALFALMLMAGCQGTPPAVTTEVPPAVPVDPPSAAPTPQPVEVVAPTPAPLGVKGRAMLGDSPFGAAAIAVYELGKAAPIATGRAGDDGRFEMPLSQQPPSGRLLKVTATLNGRTLAGLIADEPAKAGYHVAALADVELTLTTTLAFWSLRQRFEAAAPHMQPEQAQKSITLYQGLVAALAKPLGGLSDSTAQEAIATALDAPTLSNSLQQVALRVTQADPQVDAAFRLAGEQLGEVLRQAPEAAANQVGRQSVVFGNAVVSGPSVGGSGGGSSAPRPVNVEVQVGEPSDGTYNNPQAPVSGEAN